MPFSFKIANNIILAIATTHNKQISTEIILTHKKIPPIQKLGIEGHWRDESPTTEPSFFI